MARHRSPGGKRPSSIPAIADAAPARTSGAHRLPRPSAATRGRFVVAAVAVGAVTASQGFGYAEQSDGNDDGSRLLSHGGDAAAFTGVGGTGPAPGTLPLPEVVPVVQETLHQDVNNLAKGARIATERAAAEEAARLAAERAAAERAAAEQAAQLPVSTGSIVAPTIGELTSGFGSRWGTSHYGIDIANDIGTPIYATTDGVVIESGPASGFGMWVQVEHEDGTVSVYGHINEALVSVGQEVAAGEQIATMGNRGQSTGPHLHFEIWLNGEEKVDPLSWLEENGVSL